MTEAAAARIGRIALADAVARPFWLDTPDAPDPGPPLTGQEQADLAVVGAGFTGLWAALQAKEADPELDVIVLEADRVAAGASGRNGGFVESSLTHGLPNGIARFPREIHRLEELGRENLAALEETIARHGIDAEYEKTGLLLVATREHELAGLAAHLHELRSFGYEAEWLDREAMRAEVHSETFLGGLWHRSHSALVNPARLAWGLAETAGRLGVRIYEATPATGLEEDGTGVRVRTPAGRVRARRGILATNAFPPLVRRIRRYVVPVWDYVLVTEPLSPAQRQSIGWPRRQGLADSGNRFHYYRLTADDRILWGGYEAVYYYGNDTGRAREHHPRTFDLLARNFFATFPQLAGLRFTHAWGGVIDTCSRFCVTFGTGLGGRVAYAVGYTGLGVGASRFGARVALDLADGRDTELTRLELARTKPLPFPPEPLRWLGITFTRRALARADETGRRGLWLRALDRLGLGFDS